MKTAKEIQIEEQKKRTGYNIRLENSRKEQMRYLKKKKCDSLKSYVQVYTTYRGSWNDTGS